MAKLRVHELARELNMTNKVLLDKLQAMDLPHACEEPHEQFG